MATSCCLCGCFLSALVSLAEYPYSNLLSLNGGHSNGQFIIVRYVVLHGHSSDYGNLVTCHVDQPCCFVV
ncbi:hypothetical protein BgiBS90_011083, partial [Biomphalaria glabrata]